jgi:hypothetical protein
LGNINSLRTQKLGFLFFPHRLDEATAETTTEIPSIIISSFQKGITAGRGDLLAVTDKSREDIWPGARLLSSPWVRLTRRIDLRHGGRPRPIISDVPESVADLMLRTEILRPLFQPHDQQRAR